MYNLLYLYLFFIYLWRMDGWMDGCVGKWMNIKGKDKGSPFIGY